MDSFELNKILGAILGTCLCLLAINMTFGGIQRAGERADLLAYLNSLADNPAPLPKAAEAPGASRSQ
jgi:hypothetical protein